MVVELSLNSIISVLILSNGVAYAVPTPTKSNGNISKNLFNNQRRKISSIKLLLNSLDLFYRMV